MNLKLFDFGILKVGRVDYNMKGMGLIRRAQTEKVGGWGGNVLSEFFSTTCS